MIQGMYSGISGLKANQDKLNVIGNNIANASTTAFKSQSIRFKDSIYQTVKGSTAPGMNLGGTNPILTGIGVRTSGMSSNMNQGGLESTGSQLDIGIDGSGFLMVANGTVPATNEGGMGVNPFTNRLTGTGAMNVSYTRDGSLSLDTQGNLVNSSGLRVLGYAIQDNNLQQPSLDWAQNGTSNFVDANTTAGLSIASNTLVPLRIPDKIYVTATAANYARIAYTGNLKTNADGLLEVPATYVIDENLTYGGTNEDVVSNKYIDQTMERESTSGLTFSPNKPFITAKGKSNRWDKEYDADVKLTASTIDVKTFTVGGVKYKITDEPSNSEARYTFSSEKDGITTDHTKDYKTIDEFLAGVVNKDVANEEDKVTIDKFRNEVEMRYSLVVGKNAGKDGYVDLGAGRVLDGSLGMMTDAEMKTILADLETMEGIELEIPMANEIEGDGAKASGIRDEWSVTLEAAKPVPTPQLTTNYKGQSDLNFEIKFVPSENEANIEYYTGDDDAYIGKYVVLNADDTVNDEATKALYEDYDNGILADNAFGEYKITVNNSVEISLKDYEGFISNADYDGLAGVLGDEQIAKDIIDNKIRFRNLNNPKTLADATRAKNDSWSYNVHPKFTQNPTITTGKAPEFKYKGDVDLKVQIMWSPTVERADGVKGAYVISVNGSDPVSVTDQDGIDNIKVSLPTGGSTSLKDLGVTLAGLPKQPTNTEEARDAAKSSWEFMVYAEGEKGITSFSIEENGIINGALDDGRTTVLGQIAMANFTNVQGLERLGGNLWGMSANSGEPMIKSGINAVNSNETQFGGLVSGTLEMSNVDLAASFTDMIVANRAFQANSKIITTSDEILQELVNLKR